MITHLSLSLDSNKAKEIATRFLEQHYSVLEIKQTVLENDIWTVTVLLSSSNDQMRKIRIDAKTGKIIDWSK
ncbi:MAG TPA: PepSY domain-containing protein [Nitrosopumilaceae archaeon]|nr:PepSY domain-containing protein [Nitrosopumilaceae archaeon]